MKNIDIIMNRHITYFNTLVNIKPMPMEQEWLNPQNILSTCTATIPENGDKFSLRKFSTLFLATF